MPFSLAKYPINEGFVVPCSVVPPPDGCNFQTVISRNMKFGYVVQLHELHTTNIICVIKLPLIFRKNTHANTLSVLFYVLFQFLFSYFIYFSNFSSICSFQPSLLFFFIIFPSLCQFPLCCSLSPTFSKFSYFLFQFLLHFFFSLVQYISQVNCLQVSLLVQVYHVE